MGKLTSLLAIGLGVWIALLNMALHTVRSSAQDLAILHDEVLKLDMEVPLPFTLLSLSPMALLPI